MNKTNFEQTPAPKLPKIDLVFEESNESRELDPSLLPSERYFTALVKPKHTFNENDIQTRSLGTEGSIFATLPLYKVNFFLKAYF